MRQCNQGLRISQSMMFHNAMTAEWQIDFAFINNLIWRLIDAKYYIYIEEINANQESM